MSTKNNRSIAGIVTFNPDIDRLRENMLRLKEQISDIVVIDNGSNNIGKIVEIAADVGAVLIKNRSNLGIAKALDQIMGYGKANNFEWVLTLDQDSVIMPGLITKYENAANLKKNKDVAMFTCLIKDRNFTDKSSEMQNKEYEEVPFCITSAAYTSVNKYYQTKGYDEFFFIDCVDFDLCYSLREKGFKICRINYKGLLHEVGHGENKIVLGKKIIVYHQNALRIYYLARNTVLMSRKHRNLMPCYVMLRKLLFQFIRIVLFERPVFEKMKGFFKGIKASYSRESRRRYQ